MPSFRVLRTDSNWLKGRNRVLQNIKIAIAPVSRTWNLHLAYILQYRDSFIYLPRVSPLAAHPCDLDDILKVAALVQYLCVHSFALLSNPEMMNEYHRNTNFFTIIIILPVVNNNLLYICCSFLNEISPFLNRILHCIGLT